MADTTYRLVIRRGPELNKMFELTAPLITLGRDIINDITISDPEMSRQHCQLTRTDEGYTLEDLTSTNGTFINGERLVGSRPLKNGDSIGFGETVIVTYTATSMPVLPSKESGGLGISKGVQGGSIQPDAETSQIPVVKTSAPATAPAEAPAPPAYVYAPPPVAPTTSPAANRMVLFGCGVLTTVCVIVVLLGVVFIDASGRWGDVPVIGDAVESAPVDMETLETQDFQVPVPKDWDYGRLEVEGTATMLIARDGNLEATANLEPNFGKSGGVWVQFLAKSVDADALNVIASETLELNELSTELVERNEDTFKVDGEEGNRLTAVNADGDYLQIIIVEKGTDTLLFIAFSPAKDRQDNEKIFDYVLDHLRFE